jgi:hypothetical protein
VPTVVGKPTPVGVGLTQVRDAHARSTAQGRPAARSNDWHLCVVTLQFIGPWQSLKVVQLSPILVPAGCVEVIGWQIEPATVLQKKPSSQLSGECRHLSPLLARARVGATAAGTGRGAVATGAAAGGAAASGAAATGASTMGATGTGAATGALAVSFEVSGRGETVHAVTSTTAEQTTGQTR